MTLSSKARRRKGHNYERELARYFTDNGIEAERNLEYQTGSKGDVRLLKKPEYIIQAKNQTRPPILPALKQAEDDIQLLVNQNKLKEEVAIPIAICKVKGLGIEKSIVTLRLEDFIELIKE